MHQFFLNEPLSDDALKAPLVLSRKEYQHLFVLRLREGEQFLFADGCGREHLFEVIATNKNTITAKCLETRASENELSCQLVLLQGLPKREKLEFIIQKAVELGAHDIVPVMMARSNVRIDEKKADRKAERLHEISKSAASMSPHLFMLFPLSARKNAALLSVYKTSQARRLFQFFPKRIVFFTANRPSSLRMQTECPS